MLASVEQFVGEVGRVRAQGVGGRTGAQDGRLGEHEGTADGLLGGAGEVGRRVHQVALEGFGLADAGERVALNLGDQARDPAGHLAAPASPPLELMRTGV